jgi:hypothetical protein
VVSRATARGGPGRAGNRPAPTSRRSSSANARPARATAASRPGSDQAQRFASKGRVSSAQPSGENAGRPGRDDRRTGRDQVARRVAGRSQQERHPEQYSGRGGGGPGAFPHLSRDRGGRGEDEPAGADGQRRERRRSSGQAGTDEGEHVQDGQYEVRRQRQQQGGRQGRPPTEDRGGEQLLTAGLLVLPRVADHEQQVHEGRADRHREQRLAHRRRTGRGARHQPVEDDGHRARRGVDRELHPVGLVRVQRQHATGADEVVCRQREQPDR